MSAVSYEMVKEVTRFEGQPLVIVGAGPSYSYSLVNALFESPGEKVNVFALNHTIAELYKHPRAWWVSNDHDRTFGNPGIRNGLLPRIKGYEKWKTITQRQFIPGKYGAVDWIDFRGRKQGPMKFRLPCPDGSHIAWYHGGGDNSAHFEGYVQNGHSVLELALEVATMWKFSPIMMIGCDMFMPSEGEYYAEPFRWKETPKKIVHGKMVKARQSIVDNRGRWSKNIFSYNHHWRHGPFFNAGFADMLGELLDLGNLSSQVMEVTFPHPCNGS